MHSSVGSAARAGIKKMTGRTTGAGSKRQSQSMFPSLKGCCTQVKKNSMQVFFIIASWCLWLGRGSPDCPSIPMYILNLTNCFSNQMMLLSQSGFTVSCTHQTLSLRLIINSKILFQSWDATFWGLCLASCLPLMAHTSHLSVPLNYGLFTLWSEMSQKIEGQNLLVRHLNMLLICKQ